ncbi:chorismate-binding protein [Mariniflexile sp.]|uniref:chorismate-binding protein n=1 Tax=Mariniflexile sp. TaxID=1979402 RepID=UPI0040487233
MEDFFKRIETHYSSQLPFVVYRKPRESKVNALLQRTNDLHLVNDFTEKGFVFAPFDETEDSILISLEAAEVINFSGKFVIPAKIHSVETNASLEAKNNHINLVKKGIEAIKDGQFKKVVLSRQETASLSAANPISIFKNLLNRYASAFVYCWYHPQVGLWLGATPETLMKIDGHRFSIMALAGTQEYHDSLNVSWGQKEQLEQKIVTDFIVESLKPSVESLEISDTETVKAGNLLHLKTMISAKLKSDSNLKQLISDLHPTPAVCGLPKLATKAFILKNENYNRAFYTGFLGELNFETTTAPRTSNRNIENRAYSVTRNSTQLYVNLRCMQLKKGHAIIYVGGGITENSNAESEWQETISKSFIIKNVL